VGTTGFNLAVILGLASSVSDFISKLEHDLGVDGTELTVLFCLVLAALVVLLMLANRASKKKALRIAHAGSFVAPDPFARSFRLQRSVGSQRLPDPVTDGPARDLSNPRYRPETRLLNVPDPAFPAHEDTTRNFESSSGVPPLIVSSPIVSSPIGASPIVSSPIVSSPIGASPIGVTPLGQSPFGVDPAAPSVSGLDPSVTNPPSGPGGVAIATAAPLVGWYEDPDGTPGSLRFWDGKAWTARRQV